MKQNSQNFFTLFLIIFMSGLLISGSVFGQKIIWVSGVVQDAGGVDSDQGFVDLLIANGYDVQRENDTMTGGSLSAKQRGVLESGDLVIVSRSTNSGSYNTTDWNEIRKPIINITSYLSRANRWQWLENSNLLGGGDSGCPLYHVEDLAHPIFNGIIPDADGNVAVLDPAVGSGQTSLPDCQNIGNGQMIATAQDTGTVVIAYWPWNTKFHDGTEEVAAAPRLLFNAGARENDLDPGNLQGLMNLTPDGQTMFLNAVAFMLTPPAFAITIDAMQDEWYQGLKGPDDGYLQIRYFSHNDIGKPDGDADCSAKIWSAWDADWFYMYAEVTDDAVLATSPTDVWRNDCIELKVDGQATDETETAVSFDTRITAWAPEDVEPGQLTDNLAPLADEDKQFARRMTDDGYVLEFAIKLDKLGGSQPITAAIDEVFGLGIHIVDNDDTDRSAAIQWSAVLKDAIWNTPKFHGTVKFLEDNVISFIPVNNMTGETNTLPYDGSLPPIMIDAQKDPFYDGLTGPDDGWVYIPHQQYNTNGAPENDLDCSANLWVAWDDTYMYFYEEVTDEKVNLNNVTGYQNDCFEVYFDPDPTQAAASGQMGFRLTALDSADADPAAIAGVGNMNAATAAGFAGIGDNPTKGDYARRLTDNGYALECRVKWEWLTIGTRGPVVPAVGNSFGMATMNHDNDFGGREGSITWATVNNDNVWNNPSSHATVQFLEDGKLKLIAKNSITGDSNANPTWYDPNVSFRIAIDAVMDPWYNTLTGPDDGYVYIPAAAFNNNGAPDDDKDLSALLWVAWDDTYLYFYEEVADQVVNLNNATGWQNDCLEIYFDPDPSQAATSGQCGFRLTALDSADAEESVWAGVGNMIASGGAAWAGFADNATSDDYARALTDNGYVLEGRVKWEWISIDTRGPIVPGVGTIFGMATMNHDNDVAGREGSVSWSCVMDDNVWGNPQSHATVEFLDDHKLKLIAANAITGAVNENADEWYNPNGIIKVEVAENKDILPTKFNLSQNYPNPFNPTTTIAYDLPTKEQVRLTVFDILGRKVATLVDNRQEAGSYTISFDARGLATGMYIYRIEAGSFTKTAKMMVIK